MSEFDNFTPEELAQLKAEVDQRLQANESPKETQVRLTLPSGEVVEGTQQEVQGKVDEFYAHQRQTQHQPKQNEDRPQFDQKQFFEKANSNFDDGMNYYWETKYGYKPHDMISLLAASVNKLNVQLQEQNFERTVTKIDGFHVSDKNKEALNKIIREKGWDGSQSAYQDAFYLAQGRGLLEGAPKQDFKFPQGTPQPGGNKPYNPAPGYDPDNYSAPPRVGQGAFPESASQPAVDEFYNRTVDMPTDKVRSILEQMESKFTN